MSAREAIENLWDRSTPVGPLLDAYEREVLRKAADRIRGSEELRNLTDDHMRDCNAAADLIDPGPES